ncbi:MAG: caspase family protein [Alphaproteobacteria bacterium]|nr:caspase family protein [Alphaproteobacteria bacterium]
MMMARLFSLRSIGAVLATAGALLFACPAPAQVANAGVKRVALVIGNSAYKEQPLKNPANDAKAMAAKLRQIGFQVIERQNATKSQMEKAIADFGEALSAGAVGLFYYAGHGLQASGRNFLVPVDATITSEQRVRLEALDVDVVLDQMDAAKSGVNLVILDACRNNPFERRFRAAGGGLAQINAPQGTLIAYATAPGKVAADGDGANGLYTSKLLQHIGTPGMAVEEVFKRVRVDVSRDTNADQTPWESSSLTGSFMFVDAPPPAPAPPPPQVAAAPAASAVDREALFWQSAKDSDDPGVLQSYLTQYPNGTFAPLAKAKLAAVEKQRQEQAQRSAPVQQAAAPAPGAQRTLTPGNVDGTWQGSYSCTASQGSGQPAFDNPGRVFQVRDGKLTGRFMPGGPNSGNGVEEYSGTIAADGAVSITGEGSNPKGQRPYTIRLQGKAADGRFTATGKHGDRDCTLSYAKIR